MDVRADEHRDGVRPRDAGVLVPPALHDDGDVEAQHEGQRDEVAVRLAVLDHGLEHPETGRGGEVRGEYEEYSAAWNTLEYFSNTWNIFHYTRLYSQNLTLNKTIFAK